jgi:hypothetical protein
VDERLVPEEVQMPPHPLARVMHHAIRLDAPILGTGETGPGLETDPHMQLAAAVPDVPELHRPDLPGIRQLQRGSKQIRSIHAPNLPETHPATNQPHPPQTAKSLSIHTTYLKWTGFCS